MGEKKLHYKMYKDGKKWCFAAIAVITFGVGLSESAYTVKANSSNTVTSKSSDTMNLSQPKPPAKPVNPIQQTTPAKPVNPIQQTTPAKPVNLSATKADSTSASKALATDGDSKDLKLTVTYTKKAPTITPEKKTVNETIHYQGAGNQTPADHTAQVTFTRQGSTDAVTGEKTYGPWSADQSFAAVTSPAIKGYTADQAQIDTITGITAGSVNVEKTVTYTPNVEKANVTYIDDTTGKKLITKDLTGNYGTTDSYQTGNTIQNYENHGYKLVSDGYPATGVEYNEDGTVKNYEVHLTHGTTQTSGNQTVNETIHYQGAGNQTPADHTAQVTFTHQGSTDAVTGEKTYGPWSAAQSFAAVKSPELKGYTPDQAEIGSQPVNVGSKDLAFTVTYTKKAPTITQEKKTVNETIHYQGAGHQTPADNTAQVTFTRPVSTDAVTGEKTYGNWSADQSFDEVTSPELKGYTPDQAEIDKQTVTGDSSNLDFTVVYTANRRSTPVKPAKPVIPAKLNNLGKSTNPSKLVQNSNMASVRNKKQANENEMPQTGENNSQSQTMSFIGILLAMFGSLLGFLGIKKHRND